MIILVVKNPSTKQETQDTLGQEDPLDEGIASHSVFLPGKSRGQRSLVGYSLWDHKESDTTKVTEHARILYEPAHVVLYVAPTHSFPFTF